MGIVNGASTIGATCHTKTGHALVSQADVPAKVAELHGVAVRAMITPARTVTLAAAVVMSNSVTANDTVHVVQ